MRPSALALQIPLNDEPEITIIPDDPDAFDLDECSIYAEREDDNHRFDRGRVLLCRSNPRTRLSQRIELLPQVRGGASVDQKCMWAAMTKKLAKLIVGKVDISLAKCSRYFQVATRAPARDITWIDPRTWTMKRLIRGRWRIVTRGKISK